MVKRLMCCMLAASGAFAQGAPSAGEQFAQLLKRAKEARQAKDERSLLATSLELARLLQYSGPATEQLALVYAEMGDQERALQELHEFIAMGQCDDQLTTRPQFERLKSSPEFKQIVKDMEANKVPAEQAIRVAEFPDANLVPEDIDYDAQSKSFLVTSVLEKKIVRMGLDGVEKDFAKAPDGWPMLAIKIDSRRGIVWATEVALNNFASAPQKDWGRSAVLRFRLKDGSLTRKFDEPHAALGDMALAPDGDAIVSDNDGGGVYRIRADAKSGGMERIDGGQFISPQTPAVEPDGRHIFVPDYAGGIGLLDAGTKQVRWIEANRQHALQGIDGLYFTGETLIAAQNGTSPERVVSFRLDAGLDRVASEEIIERSTLTLGDPTHGVMVGDNFYYIANSGWDCLDDDGKLKPGAKMTPGLIMKAAKGHS